MSTLQADPVALGRPRDIVVIAFLGQSTISNGEPFRQGRLRLGPDKIVELIACQFLGRIHTVSPACSASITHQCGRGNQENFRPQQFYISERLPQHQSFNRKSGCSDAQWSTSSDFCSLTIGNSRNTSGHFVRARSITPPDEVLSLARGYLLFAPSVQNALVSLRTTL